MSLTARLEALEAVVAAQHAWIQGSQRVNLRALHLLEKVLTHRHSWECARHSAHHARENYRGCSAQQDFGFGYGSATRAPVEPLWFASGERLDDVLREDNQYANYFQKKA